MMQQKKTFVTEEGLKKMQEELHRLKTVRRREVAQAIQSAKEQGDLSENAEYVDAKEEQGLLEQRIAELEASVKSAEVIQKGDSETIEVGSTITIHMNGTERTYTIVGPNEADPTSGRISNESPLGTAVLGKKHGDTVSIRTPVGSQEARILNVA